MELTKEQMENLKTAVTTGIYTVNEARENLDLPRVEGGDVNIVNGTYSSKTNGESFEIIMVLDGKGYIESNIADNVIELNAGKTVLIPASLGNYFVKTDDTIKMLRVTL